MEKIKILIVEDEMIIAEDIADILKKNSFAVAGIARNFPSAIQIIQDGQPDLVLLDIKIRGEQDGIDLAKEIRADYKIPFIFISSYSDSTTVKRAGEVNPYGYLVKPFEEPDVLVAVEMALSNFAKEQSNGTADFVLNDCLFVRDKNLMVKIPMNEIVYIKAEGNYATIKARSRSYVLRSTLKEIEARLPGKLFYRTHKSFLVSLQKITAINADGVYLDDEKLPIGRHQLQQLLSVINKI